MKKIFILATSLIMVVVLCFSVVGCSVQTATSTVTDFEATSFDEVVVESTEEETVTVNSGRHETVKHEMKLMTNGTTNYANNYTAQTLIATVTPASATVKDVIWSIAWESPNQSAGISSYFAVIPSYEGSNVAEVRCYAEPQFADANAIVTATTVDGGYTATCRVIFRGKPTSMRFEPRNMNIDDDGNFLCETEGWHKYEIGIVYENVQNYVHSDYMKTTIEKLSLTGNVLVADAYEDPSGEISFYANTEKTIKLSNFIDYFDVEVKYENGTPVLVLKYDLQYMCEGVEEGPSDDYLYNGMFRSLIDGEEYIMTLRVTNNTGVSDIITLKFAISVTDITLNQNEIYF